MEETSLLLKRVREEETQEQEEEIFKRQKSYKDIITLLEEEEDDPNEDLSSLVSTLLEEISSSGSDPVQSGSDRSEPGSVGEEEIMRHLLEASDDELGIPNISNNSSGEMDGIDGGHVEGGDLLLHVGEGLWEFEDNEATSYYNLLESEVFI